MRTLIGACLACAPLTGCQDPAYKAAQAVRYERIESLGDTYAAAEVDRPGRIRALGASMEADEERHAAQLRATWTMIEDAHAQDVRDWRAHAPVRRQWMHSTFDGRLHRVPGVYRELAY